METFFNALTSMFLRGYRFNQSVAATPANYLYDSLFRSLKGKTKANEVLTLAKLVSLTRIFFAEMIVKHRGQAQIALFLLVMAAYSDLLDGQVANKSGSTSSGSVVDPVCDKYLTLRVLFAYIGIINPVVAWTVICGEIFIFLAPLAFLKIKQIPFSKGDLRSNIYGKTKFAIELLGLLAAALGFGKLSSVAFFVAIPMIVSSVFKKLKDSF